VPETMTRPVARISHLKDFVGQEVTVQGWLYNKRSKGKLQFLQIRDGSGTVQAVVVKSEVSEETWEAADRLSQEASCLVSGVVPLDRLLDEAMAVANGIAEAPLVALKQVKRMIIDRYCWRYLSGEDIFAGLQPPAS